MRKAATVFTTAILDSNFNAAYEVMHPDFQAVVPKNFFEKFLRDRGIFQLKEIKRHIGDYGISSHSGYVEPLFIRHDNICFPVRLSFIYINKKWCIGSIDIRLSLNPVSYDVIHSKDNLD